ncbi:hypothetical protein PbJCM13498_34700 [Prolixibacter bellariivorans]|uniref:Lipoprotein n=1 Tax=Prolixibacter bellariivorans TaxID=314319 RepID=A0A5M4B4I5_9BACT|nr:hypothetical protein [Prolixibacter bellariivorans]GET34607.1 hypothetical protein PbJCM13498_34700 [Prolixibacter bellariivorans]
MKKLVFSILIGLIPLIYSCTYSTGGENFVDVDQNTTPPQVQNLTLDLNQDTLVVYQKTRYNFHFVSDKQPILGVVITLNNQDFVYDTVVGSIDIDPKVIPEGVYSMAMKVYTHTGTGSLADKTGTEAYLFQKTWVVIVEHPRAPDLKVTSSIENGFLRFHWDKFDSPFFYSYRLFIDNSGIGASYDHEFTDSNITSFVDSFYVGGKIRLQLFAKYRDLDGNIKATEFDYTYDYPLEMHIQENPDSLTVSWPSQPFQSKAFFSTSQSIDKTAMGADTSITLPAPGMGRTIDYQLEFQPVKKWRDFYLTYYQMKRYTLGVDDGQSFTEVVYDPSIHSFFVKSADYLRRLDAHLEVIASYDHSYDYKDNHSLAISKNHQTVYAVIAQQRRKFSMTLLNDLGGMPNGFGDNATFRVVKNLNDTIFLVGHNSNFSLLNILSNRVITTTDPLRTSGSIAYYQFAVSSDGHYAAFANELGVSVYEVVNDRQFVLQYENSNAYYSCLFNPREPNELVLNAQDGIHVMDCSTGQITRNLNQFVANPINFDPVTNNLLLVSNSQKKIYVYDYENNVVKLTLNHRASAWDFRLLNNTILFDAGYHLAVSDYVH